MRYLRTGFTILCFMVVGNCDKDITKAIDTDEIKLVLTADNLNGSAPMEIHFTGTLNGKIDTLLMCVPDMALCLGTGKPCILYCMPDTSQPAQRVYTADETYSIAGDFKAVMMLLSKQGLIYSDSLSVHVE